MGDSQSDIIQKWCKDPQNTFSLISRLSFDPLEPKVTWNEWIQNSDDPGIDSSDDSLGGLMNISVATAAAAQTLKERNGSSYPVVEVGANVHDFRTLTGFCITDPNSEFQVKVTNAIAKYSKRKKSTDWKDKCKLSETDDDGGAVVISYETLLNETMKAFRQRVNPDINYFQVMGVVGLLYTNDNHAEKIDYLIRTGVFANQSEIDQSTKIVLQTLAVSRNPDGVMQTTSAANNIRSLGIQAGGFFTSWGKDGIVRVIIRKEVNGLVNAMTYLGTQAFHNFQDVFLLISDTSMFRAIRGTADNDETGPMFKPFLDAIQIGLEEIWTLAADHAENVSCWCILAHVCAYGF